MAISVPHILGGTYIVETVFSYPGIGTLSYESVKYADYNMLYQMQKPQRIPEIMRDYCLNEWEAEKIFLYMLHGNFAVNKSLGWDKNDDWYHVQNVIKKILKP